MYKEFPTYAATLSGDILDIYDVTLVLHNGTEAQEVALTKANGETKELGAQNATCYKYSFAKVNGEDGVYSVEAKVTPKADIKTILESMPAEMSGNIIYGADIVKAIYNNANGKNVGEMYKNENVQLGLFTPSEMLKTMEDGAFAYEKQGKILEDYLTRKIQ